MALILATAIHITGILTRTIMIAKNFQLLRLLQLASPALPIGAYSYSEGLETLCDRGAIQNQEDLKHWLGQELQYGAIRIEAAVMLRAYRATQKKDGNSLKYWNNWLSATRETEELRLQSWQMGQSLLKLVSDMNGNSVEVADSDLTNLVASLPSFRGNSEGQGCNLAIAYGLTAAIWLIDEKLALIAYLHSWLANLVSAGVKLIPLGQTVGQQILFDFNAQIERSQDSLLMLADDEMESCSWGLAISSMTHETQYSRLFRS
ncbi:urease accessory protein UreF [Tumidithrix helvetica]|uniref:urease accessory protein UreF n=1 Tax=Tumidithrix helvetica TaxID=3457545 RepID=UPI003CC58953